MPPSLLILGSASCRVLVPTPAPHEDPFDPASCLRAIACRFAPAGAAPPGRGPGDSKTSRARFPNSRRPGPQTSVVSGTPGAAVSYTTTVELVTPLFPKSALPLALPRFAHASPTTGTH